MTTTTIATIAKGLLVRLEARTTTLSAFLAEDASRVAREPDTTAWFAVRFGRSEYGLG
jgi:hypothetical protein